MAFLQNVIKNPVFQAGNATVNFIGNNPALLHTSTGLDRGTKTVRYLANVLVNGNPDVKFIDKRKLFRRPIVPPFDRRDPYPKGSKDMLNEMGREKFITWLGGQNSIQYTDTTFRDAHQSLMATRMRTMDMFEVAESFARNHPEVFFHGSMGRSYL